MTEIYPPPSTPKLCKEQLVDNQIVKQKKKMLFLFILQCLLTPFSKQTLLSVIHDISPPI